MTQPPSKADNEAAFLVLLDQLKAWNIAEEAVDTVHDAARASMAEVKALTEYEDGKVSRLLTVVAFLSAVVGAVFTRFASDYAWPRADLENLSVQEWLTAGTYLAFILYTVAVAVAVWRLLGAIRPTFNVPATWKGSGRTGLPSSMLFYKGILDVTPQQWGAAFETLSGGEGHELKRYYAKCYVVEAYLIAQKVANKLKVIEPGVRLLRFSILILAFFFGLYGATILFAAPTRDTSSPTTVLPQKMSPAPPTVGAAPHER